MRKIPRGNVFIAGQSPGLKAKEYSFSQAKKLGIDEVTVEKKEFFRPVKIKNPRKKT